MFQFAFVCIVHALLSRSIMPPKSKRSSKKADKTGDCSPWLNKFCSKHGIPAALVEVLAEHHVTSETILAGITEQDLSDMRLVVGHKIILRRVIATLNKPSDLSTDLAPSLPGSTSPEVSLQPFKLADELAKIEAEFNESKTAPPATPRHSLNPQILPNKLKQTPKLFLRRVNPLDLKVSL